jgi:hypothetical protein
VKLDSNNELGFELFLTLTMDRNIKAVNSSNLPIEQIWKSFLDIIENWGKAKDAIEAEARKRISRIS